MSDETADTFFNGRLTVYQAAEGYRFSIDAVLLAAIPTPKSGETVVDIGTGCGIIPILLAYRYPNIQVVGLELQPELAAIAEKNVAANGLQHRIAIINTDARSFAQDRLGGPVEWVVSNPPYRSADSGRINPNCQRALARHEIHLTLKELLSATRRILKTGGRFATIYPVDRTVDLFYEMRAAGIEPKWMQSIHSRAGEKAKLVLVQGSMQGKPGMKVAPPLIVYQENGDYTDAVSRLMGP